MQGNGSFSHNNQTFKAKNNDGERTKNNVTFVKIPIAKAYNNRFSEAVECMEGFQKRNPNFYVFNAVLHNDETALCLYIDYIPIGAS